MSRAVADATRFTATSPHAYSKSSSILRSTSTTFSASSTPSPSSSSTSTPPFRRPPPSPANSQPPETPQQKVARLRAQRAAQKLNQLTLWDKTVIGYGDHFDHPHRYTQIPNLNPKSSTFNPYLPNNNKNNN
ncbi:MAG: hypothetical protein Q9181_008273 [Wetmoreana brouardii]